MTREKRGHGEKKKGGFTSWDIAGVRSYAKDVPHFFGYLRHTLMRHVPSVTFALSHSTNYRVAVLLHTA